MKSYILLLLAICTSASIWAAHPPVKGYVLDETKAPLPGANVYWLGTTEGVTSNEKGYFEIPENESSNKLVVSYIGYTPDTLTLKHAHEPFNIILGGIVNLKEVTVSERKVGTLTSRIEPLQTQTIGSAELCRAACCNLGESFETNPSVDVSYSDAVTGAKQIQLLGLSGRYVQMLTENIPNFRGASSAYGLNYVPGPWMQSIQISKGTSSVKNGYEALTGQINVEYKKPHGDSPLSLNLFGSDAGRVEVNADAQHEFSESVGGSFFAHYSNETVKHDGNGDGFLDQPLTRQLNLINRWYFSFDKYASQLGIKYLQESRDNGQIMPAGSTASPYNIGIDTKRGELFTKQAIIFNKETGNSIALIANLSIHDQKSNYGLRNYNVQQNNVYLSLMYENQFTPMHGLSAGASLNIDQTNELFRTPGNADNRYYRNETVAGLYGQYTLKPIEKLTLLFGLRADNHNEYGTFVTPRFHLKYNILDEYLHLRASVGKGYRSINVWAENNNLMASSRTAFLVEPLKMEEATNFGASLTGYIPIAEKQLTLTGEWYYTDFQNQLVTDMDADPHKILFYNLHGRSYASSAQIEATYPFFKGFTLTAAYRLTDTKVTYNGILREKPLTNRSKGLVTASYQTPLQKWQFDFTAQFNGGGRMPDPDPVKPLWDKEFKPFTIMNAQITRYFRTWSIYVGCDNIADFKMKNPIIDPTNPFGDNFDATMVWGPVHGRKFYAGIRWALPSKEH